jgi:hypothetical protein
MFVKDAMEKYSLIGNIHLKTILRHIVLAVGIENFIIHRKTVGRADGYC